MTTVDSSDPSSSPSPETPPHPDVPSGEGLEQDDTPGNSPHREAAKYRRRLRETEAERDQLAEQLTELKGQLAQIHDGKLTEALGGRVNVAALRNFGADLNGIIRPDGSVDAERARQVMKDHGIEGPKVGAVIPLAGTGSIGPAEKKPSWSEAIRQRHQ